MKKMLFKCKIVLIVSMFLLNLSVSAEEPMQGADSIKNGNYISADGCMETHGYGMAEDAWKVIKSAGKYYIIDFDIRCGKDVKPYFISDGFLFSRQLHIEFKPMNIQKKHQFTVGHDNQVLMQKSDNIIISLSEKQKDKAKKYLLKIDKETLSDRDKINKERAKRMLNPDGYIVFAKPAYAKYQRVFDWAPTFAMIKAISEQDIETVKILLKSKEKVNECVENGTVSYAATAYEVLEAKKKEIADEIQEKKSSFMKVPEELKEAKKKIVEIYQLFKRDGQISTCENKKLKLENYAQKAKWIIPSESICQSEGGEFNNGVCEADWLKARRICRLGGGRLPNIDELKAEITSCGGKVGDWEDNIRNQSFVSCIKEKNFHNFKNYWSLSLEKKEKDRVYMMNVAMSAGDIRKSYPIDDFPEAVMCVQEPDNNEQIQEDTHTDKWITPEHSICQKEGGKLDIGACKANWQQAQNICRASGGTLPSIDEFKAVVASCDGKIANSEVEQINNIKNTNYQQCYKQKGFSDLDYYWSSTDVGTPGARWQANMWNGTIRWNVESAHYYVRCVRDRKKYTKPLWCTAPRLNKTERTICTDVILSAMDIKLAEIYGASTVHRKDVAQRAWLKKRNSCGSNISCIKNTYENRIRSLQDMTKKDIEKERTKQDKVTKEKKLPSIRYTSLDKEVLKNVKKSMHNILDRDIKAFSNITDSGRVYERKEYERLFGGSDIPWKKNFPYLDGVTHADIDTLQVYKKADRDKERTCRYLATGKKVPCKSLEYCFATNSKMLPNKGCLDMYYIQGKIYWEPFGW